MMDEKMDVLIMRVGGTHPTLDGVFIVTKVQVVIAERLLQGTGKK